MARMPMPEDRLKQLLAEATDAAVYDLTSISHSTIPTLRHRFGIPNPWAGAEIGIRKAAGRVVLERWKDWQDGVYPDPISREKLDKQVTRAAKGETRAKQTPTMTPAALLVAARQHFIGPGRGHWPSLDDLRRYCGETPETVKRLVENLIDRRLAVMDGDQVVPWEAKPSTVVVRQMTDEERARYGPPGPMSRMGERQPRPIGLFPDPNHPPTPEKQEVHDEMNRIDWPEDSVLIARAEKLMEQHDNWAAVLAQQIGCHHVTLRGRMADARFRLAQRAKEEAAATQQAEATPAVAQSTNLERSNERTGENRLHQSPPVVTEAPGQGVGSQALENPQNEAMSHAEALPLQPLAIVDNRTLEQRILDGDAPAEVQIGRLTEDQLLDVFGEEEADDAGADAGAVLATLERAVMDQANRSLATHVTLILIDESADLPAQVRPVHEHLTQAPECVGDRWAEPIRVNGYRDYRIWTAVGVVVLGDGPVFVMMPAGTRLVLQAAEAKGAA